MILASVDSAIQTDNIVNWVMWVGIILLFAALIVGIKIAKKCHRDGFDYFLQLIAGDGRIQTGASESIFDQ